MPPEINQESCNSCHRCVMICSEDVFYESEKCEIPQITYPDFCYHCNCCVRECPIDGAIRLRIPLAMQVAYK